MDHEIGHTSGMWCYVQCVTVRMLNFVLGGGGGEIIGH